MACDIVGALIHVGGPPWSATEPETRDIAAMGYMYA